MDSINWTMTGCTVCLMLTLHFTIQLASQHLLSWKKPKEQKAILVIIMMAPLYAIISYIGLIDFLGSKTFFTFLESLKECYEALVMAKFLALMYTYLNISISNNIVPDEIKGREIHHSFPMTLFQGIALEILAAVGIIKSHHVWFDVEHIQEALQNIFVIVEMVFFAFYQQSAYTAAPYRQAEATKASGTTDKKKD
nr:transmembrane protein 184C-like [Ipomoea batatas]